MGLGLEKSKVMILCCGKKTLVVVPNRTLAGPWGRGRQVSLQLPLIRAGSTGGKSPVYPTKFLPDEIPTKSRITPNKFHPEQKESLAKSQTQKKKSPNAAPQAEKLRTPRPNTASQSVDVHQEGTQDETYRGVK
jgi:hypothetical protein